MYVPVCNYEGHFWPKKKCLFYFAVGSGTDFNRYRLRFCPAHAVAVDEDLAEFEVGSGHNTLSALKVSTAKCFSCGQPFDHAGCQVFVTGYPTQDERKDYWFQIHGSCALPDYMQDLYSNP